jgi:hypothetical protein
LKLLAHIYTYIDMYIVDQEELDIEYFAAYFIWLRNIDPIDREVFAGTTIEVSVSNKLI